MLEQEQSLMEYTGRCQQLFSDFFYLNRAPVVGAGFLLSGGGKRHFKV